MDKHIVVYMSPWCGGSSDTQRTLNEWGLPATYVNIKEDREAAARLKSWVGFESVPTVVLTENGNLEPCEIPEPLAKGASPRGVDRGCIITEATRVQLKNWLVKNGLLEG